MLALLLPLANFGIVNHSDDVKGIFQEAFALNNITFWDWFTVKKEKEKSNKRKTKGEKYTKNGSEFSMSAISLNWNAWSKTFKEIFLKSTWLKKLDFNDLILLSTTTEIFTIT